MQVTGNNPDPSSTFAGSVNGTTVELSPGPFQVVDKEEPSVAEELEKIDDEFNNRLLIFGPDPSFSGDCNAPDDSFTGNGTIGQGQELRCNVENHFEIGFE